MKNEYWNWPPHFSTTHHNIVSGVSCSNSILLFLSSKLSSFWSLFSLLDFFVGWLFETELLLGEGERGLGDDTWTGLSSWTCSSMPWRKLNLRCFVQVGSITLFYYHGHFFTNLNEGPKKETGEFGLLTQPGFLAPPLRWKHRRGRRDLAGRSSCPSQGGPAQKIWRV